MGKSTISMAIFNSYVYLPEGTPNTVLSFSQTIPGSCWIWAAVISRVPASCVSVTIIVWSISPPFSRSILHGYFNHLVFWYQWEYLLTSKEIVIFCRVSKIGNVNITPVFVGEVSNYIPAFRSYRWLCEVIATFSEPACPCRLSLRTMSSQGKAWPPWRAYGIKISTLQIARVIVTSIRASLNMCYFCYSCSIVAFITIWTVIETLIDADRTTSHLPDINKFPAQFNIQLLFCLLIDG